MNEQLKSYARRSLKDGLAQLPETWHQKFKLMYARDGGRRSVEESLAMPINEVVDMMPEDKLGWAMSQVENSLKKLAATHVA
jgi:hypothetical protein